MSIGTIQVTVKYCNGLLLELEVDAINVDTSLLLGLQTLYKYMIYVRNVENTPVCTRPQW